MKTRRYKLDCIGNGQEFSYKKILYESQSLFQKIEIRDFNLPRSAFISEIGPV